MTSRNLETRRVSRGPRETAVNIVATWLQTGRFPDRFMERHQGAGHAVLRELVYGSIKWQRSLQWRIERVAVRSPRREAAAHLLTAAYELFSMSDSPPHAVVHEHVAIARRRLTRKEAAFINAVLRGMLRDDDAERALESAPAALRLSHPDTLWQRWQQKFGSERAEQLCMWNNERGGIVIRPQISHRQTVPKFCELLRARSIDAVPHPARPLECISLPSGVRVESLPGYEDGDFSVQDPSTLTAVDMLAPQPGERIFDACAAPGGKTVVIADRIRGRGFLVALEPQPQRLRRLIANLKRCQWNETTVIQGDLTVAHRELNERLNAIAPEGFDAILLDVPCSNTGVLRRRPDARWRFQPELLLKLTRMQQAMLSAATACLHPGGRIVYSTCSLEDDENRSMIDGWLAMHPEFRLDAEQSLFPPDSKTDGAFAARLIRHG